MAPTYKRRDAITDEGLAHFHAAYPGETVSKEDVFYYVYGLLHSPDYRERYADNLIPAQYRVEKMKYGKKGKDKDLSTIHYNPLITVSGIPLEAYEYVVNGKSAIDWVMERQCFKTDKDSGIVNDANAWAVETMGNPRYPLELLLRVITVSLETQKIVAALPGLDI